MQSVTVIPGSEATCAVVVRNNGTIVDEAVLEVTGPAAQWTSVEPPKLPLMPGQESTALLRFRPPRSSGVRASEIPFGVRARSSVGIPGATNERGGTVTVAPFTEIRALIVPATSEGFDGAEHAITVQNEGNISAEVNLSVADAQDVLAYALQPPKHVLEPGENGVSRLRVWLRQGVSRPGQRVPFQLMAEPVGKTVVVVDGAFRQLPRPEPVPVNPKPRPWRWFAGVATLFLVAIIGAAIALGPLHVRIGPPNGPASPTPLVVESVEFSGGTGAPEVTVNGLNLGTEPGGLLNNNTPCGSYNSNGDDYGDSLWFQDVDNAVFGKGTPPTGSCVGIKVLSWSDTRVIFTFGNAYNTFDHWFLTAGDRYVLMIDGTQFSGTVAWS
jgi:hypothetical protein